MWLFIALYNEFYFWYCIIGDKLEVVEMQCEKLKPRYEHLYMSCHLQVRVKSADMKCALGLLMRSESWPQGLFVKRFLSVKLMALNNNNVTLFSFNCGSIRSFVVPEISELCEHCDFLLVQEHWLLPNETNFLSNLHKEFLAVEIAHVTLTTPT